MVNKIFYISVVLILIVGCDWGIVKNKSLEIPELLRKGKDRVKNQDRIKLSEDKSISKSNISVADSDTTSLGHSSSNLIDHSQQVVGDSRILNDKAVAPQEKVEVNLINNIDFSAINPKPTQNLGASFLSNTDIGGSAKFLLIKNNQKELIDKKTLPRKLESLESFLKTQYEKEAFKDVKATQGLISSSNIGKEIVQFKEEYDNLYNLFGDMQQKFYNQRDLFIKNTKFGENREKNIVIFKAFSFIEKEFRDLNYKLDEIQSNFQIADNSWNNANSLLKESIEKLIQSIEKRHDNEGRDQGQIGGGPSNRWDRYQADTFAKDAKHKAEHSANDLENAANYFQHGCSNKKEAKRLLEDIEKRFFRIGIL